MQHLAMIMDGNRRWAKEKKLQALTLGHRKGLDSVKVSIKFCLEKGIKYLSLYTFSLENFSRDGREQTYIFNLLLEALEKNIFELVEQGVRVRFVGDESFFPQVIIRAINEVEGRTKHLDKLHLNMLFCYGAKQEMIRATRRLAQKVKNGHLDVHEIDEEALRSEFWLNGVPDPDLIIRTGKQARLSNFLLFQAAYSELMFLDCYWPEITENRLQECVDQFYSVQRNFGK